MNDYLDGDMLCRLTFSASKTRYKRLAFGRKLSKLIQTISDPHDRLAFTKHVALQRGIDSGTVTLDSSELRSWLTELYPNLSFEGVTETYLRHLIKEEIRNVDDLTVEHLQARYS